MTPKTLFLIIIKITGLYLIASSLTVIPQFISSLYSVYSLSNSEFLVIIMALIILMMAIYALIIRYFIFRTDVIIDKLALEKHFAEEKFDINIHRGSVLKIAVIVIGALIFVDAFPLLCKQVFEYLRLQNADYYGEHSTGGWIIFYFFKVFLAYCLVNYSQQIVNFIELRRRNKNVPEETAEEAAE